jgi:hypothetical protein
MKDTIKVAPKPTIKKIEPKKTINIKKPKVELVSYSIEMTIPTGAYANIKPQIVVKSQSVEEAHDFIAPHMNKLWKEYFMINERRQEIIKPVSTAPADVVKKMSVQEIAEATGGTIVSETPAVQPPVSSVALVKATQAIESCTSLEALELIQKQVDKSVKLSHEDKESLMPLIQNKGANLTFPTNEERGK